jgi:ribosome-binding protein aMBF1 (putative translation factor)
MSVTDTIARIRRFRDRQGWRRATLARHANLHPNTLRRMDCADWSPRYDTLRALEDLIERWEQDAA